MSRPAFSPRPSAPTAARGFALVSAIFLLVILVSLAAFLVNISTTQSITSAQDVQGSRAYHAARAGAEWGLYQVLTPPAMPDCATAMTNPPPAIEGFNIALTCASTDYNEAGATVRVYQIEATASSGIVGTAGFSERQVSLRVSR